MGDLFVFILFGIESRSDGQTYKLLEAGLYTVLRELYGVAPFTTRNIQLVNIKAFEPSIPSILKAGVVTKASCYYVDPSVSDFLIRDNITFANGRHLCNRLKRCAPIPYPTCRLFSQSFERYCDVHK